MKSKTLYFVKWGISLLLLYWLIQQGEMSIQNIKIVLTDLRLLTIILILKLIQLCVISSRTYILMQFRFYNFFMMKKVFYISWASLFINSVAPSALFGELFKIKELILVDNNLNKDNTFYTVGIAKFLSVFSVLILSVVASLLVRNRPQEIELFVYYLYAILSIATLVYAAINLFLTHNDLSPLNFPFRPKSRFFAKRLENFRQYYSNIFSNKFITWYLLSLSRAS